MAIALVVFAYQRIELPRSPGLEGIEDVEAAKAYDLVSQWPQFRMLRRMIAGKLAKYQPVGTLADIGCGPGYLTTMIAQRHSQLHLIGVDLSQEMVHAGTSNADAYGLSDRVEFREGDVSSLPMPDDSLDFAITTLSLHHWSNPGHGLAEIHRVLQEGGQLLLFDLRRDPRRLFYWLLKFIQGVVVPTALRRVNEPLGSLLSSYTLDELKDLLARSPFNEWVVEGGAGWMFAWARRG
jgi:ubiquinone/menaquinone biosynthesis C-methylase UbiE